VTRLKCDRSWEAEAIDDGRSGPSDRAAFEQHATTCNVCAEAIRAQLQLRELMRALPEFPAEPFAERRARARLLQRANSELTGRRRSPAWLVVAIASVGLASVASAAIWPDPLFSKPVPAASAGPIPGGSEPARAQRRQPLAKPPAPSEAQSSNPPAELPSPGPAIGTTTSVTAGPPAPSASLSRRTVAGNAATKPGWSPDPTSTSSSEQSDDFARALAAFQRGDYGEADQLFARFRSRRPRDARSEDAAFLRAVARSRAGDTAGAARLAAEYLRAFPKGLRRAEAERLQGNVEKKH
jgi:hypothetical protein